MVSRKKRASRPGSRTRRASRKKKQSARRSRRTTPHSRRTLDPHRNVRGGAQQSNTSANTKSSRNTAVGLAAAGVVTAGVVTAATVGGVLWYNKKKRNEKRRY